MTGLGFKDLFGFAQTEFFEVMRTRNQLRLFSMVIMGAVVPIFISLLFKPSNNPSGETTQMPLQMNPYDMLSLTLLGLSFVFLLLGYRFLHYSRRHDELVTHLSEMNQEFLRYLNIRDKIDATEVNFANISFDWTSTICEFMVFIVPSVGCWAALVSILVLLKTGWTVYICVAGFLFLIIEGFLLYGIWKRWTRGLKGKKVDAYLSSYRAIFKRHLSDGFVFVQNSGFGFLENTKGTVNWAKWRKQILSFRGRRERPGT